MLQCIGRPTVSLSLPPSLALAPSLSPVLFPPAFEVASTKRLASLYSQRAECDDTRGNVTNQQRAVIHRDKTGQYCWTPTPHTGMYDRTEKAATTNTEKSN